MKKILLVGVVVILVAAAVAGLIYWKSRPQVVVLKNGTKLTFLGSSYGKHHSFKGLKSTGSRTRGRLTLDTTNDTLVVWIEAEYKQNQWPNYQLLISDPDNTSCVGAWQSTGNQIKNGVNVEGFTINAFPRRDSKMILRVGAWGNQGGMQIAKDKFVVANPGPRSFPEWHPDPLPNTQSDGDLDVTLTKCSFGGSEGFMFGSQNMSPKDPARKAVSVTLHTEQDGNVVTNWQPVQIITSDATGNSIGNNGWSNSRDGNGDATMSYQWGLWPEEKAWKLRVEMSRIAGFTNSEEWSITNVPVQKGDWNTLWNYNNNNMGQNRHSDSPVAEATLNGIHLKIYPAIRMGQDFGNNQTMGGFHIVAEPDLPPGYRMSLVEADNEQGRKLETYGFGPNGNGNGNYVFQMPNIRNAKALNLTIAVHPSRFVEFTVKPDLKSGEN
ncbi:MAG TPA: hypothetical protein VMH87_13590 [Pseudomonadales bacterium]|nr:hypothetical protein [Pseudomonadales bacterium]